METTNQQISKKMFRKYFGIFLLLYIFFSIFSIYELYYGLTNGIVEGFGLIGVLFWLFIIFIAFIVFLVLIINNAKHDNRDAFLTISKIAIVGEICIFILPIYIAVVNKSEISSKKEFDKKYELIKNATSYDDCVNMTYSTEDCASTVNEKTGDWQGCINFSIDYAKKGGICQDGRDRSPEAISMFCSKGFGCVEKNAHKVVLSNGYSYYQNTVWIGNADGTITCKKEENLYCPPTE